MDFETRDRYRGAVEEISRAGRRDETDVANAAVELARKAAVEDDTPSLPFKPCRDTTSPARGRPLLDQVFGSVRTAGAPRARMGLSTPHALVPGGRRRPDVVTAGPDFRPWARASGQARRCSFIDSALVSACHQSTRRANGQLPLHPPAAATSAFQDVLCQRGHPRPIPNAGRGPHALGE